MDGSYDADVIAAVKAFQEKNGLYVDGEAGSVTLSALFGSSAVAAGGSNTSAAAAQTSTQTAAAAGISSTSSYLKIGSTGADVKALQTALSSLGYSVGGIDGIYGNATSAAVKSYQSDHGLYADGEAGPVTLGALFPNGSSQSAQSTQTAASQTAASQTAASAPVTDAGFNTSTSYLVYGNTGAEVASVQNALKALGYSVDGDAEGTYGTATKTAVIAFQRLNGLYADGEAGPVTLTTLFSADAVRAADGANPSGTISPNSSEAEILQLEQALYSLGMVTYMDGSYDSGTAYAVQQIQKMFGLEQTGYADAETMFYINNYEHLVDNADNVQGYASSTDYLIYINITTNRVYIYTGSQGNWKELYNWGCAAGTADNPTTTGVFTVNFKGYSFDDGAGDTCYYYSSFNGPYYIHSTLFYEGTFVDSDARIGMNLSHGCVRMSLDHSYWIYENVPIGSTVVVVE